MGYNNNDPYASPTSDLKAGTGEVNEYNQSGIFSFSGRIGRLRYLAYPLTLYFLFIFVSGLIAALTGIGADGITNSDSLFFMPVWLLMLVYLFVHGVRRLNDIGWSGFLSLLYLIPVVNLILGLLLLFMPGTAKGNRYGNPPAPNTWGAKLAALIMPGIAIPGILAAIAIPAYQDYVERAGQTQQQQ